MGTSSLRVNVPVVFSYRLRKNEERLGLADVFNSSTSLDRHDASRSGDRLRRGLRKISGAVKCLIEEEVYEPGGYIS